MLNYSDDEHEGFFFINCDYGWEGDKSYKIQLSAVIITGIIKKQNNPIRVILAFIKLLPGWEHSFGCCPLSFFDENIDTPDHLSF